MKKLESDMEKMRKANEKMEKEVGRFKEEERKRDAENDGNVGALSAQKSYMEDRIKVRQHLFLIESKQTFPYQDRQK